MTDQPPFSHSQTPPRTVLITGAAGGIGRATVHLFAEYGWSVVGVDRAPFGDNFPEKGLFIQADISQEEALESIFLQASAHTDTLAALVNNAALQIAGAALAASGYRAARGGSHHHYVIQSLAHTIGADAAKVQLLDRFRKKRNVSEYERAGGATDQEAQQIISVATRLRGALIQWLKAEHPELLPEAL